MIDFQRSRRPVAYPQLLRLVTGLGAAAALGLLISLGAPGEALAASGPQEPATATAPEEDPAGPVPDPPSFLHGAVMTIEEIAGDVFVWAQSVTLTGEVLHNAFAAGQMVALDGGKVRGDMFAFAASSTIDGEVMGDLYSFSSETRIARDAVIHGNVIIFSGSIRVDGRVRGQMLGSGGLVNITGDVGGVDIEAANLTISDEARIRGNLEYKSSDEATVADGATIDGDIVWNQDRAGSDEDEEDEDPAESGSSWSYWSVGWTVWGYLANLVVGFAFLLLGGAGARLPANCLRNQPAPGLGFGFVVAVVFPVSCLVAIVLLVSLPLGVIGLILFALMCYLARLVTAQFLGDWLLRQAGQDNPSEYLSLALGVLLLLFIGWVPYAGFLVRLAAVILGIGGIYLALRERGFPWVSDSESLGAAGRVG